MSEVAPQVWRYAILGVALLVSIVSDVRARRIYDALTWPALAALLALRWLGQGVGDLDDGLVSGAVGAVACLMFFGVFAAMGKLGWGDVKLMGVVGAAFGSPLTPHAVVFISVAGAAQALVDTARNKAFKATFQAVVAPSATPGEQTRHIPYGVAIAIGSVLTMAWDTWSTGR